MLHGWHLGMNCCSLAMLVTQLDRKVYCILHILYMLERSILFIFLHSCFVALDIVRVMQRAGQVFEMGAQKVCLVIQRIVMHINQRKWVCFFYMYYVNPAPDFAFACIRVNR